MNKALGMFLSIVEAFKQGKQQGLKIRKGCQYIFGLV
jgi:hypothetical protein